jgi:hypothetical protein
MPTSHKSRWHEPSLSELLNDPVAELMMRRDCVAPADIVALVADMRQRLDARARAQAGSSSLSQ